MCLEKEEEQRVKLLFTCSVDIVQTMRTKGLIKVNYKKAKTEFGIES